MLIFKALHLLSMFSAVTILIGHELFLATAIRRRDVRALATIHRLAGGRSSSALGGMLLLVGVGFGLITAATGGFNFFAGWMIAAYGLVVAMVLVNSSPWVRRLIEIGEEAVEAERGDRPPEEVAEAMAGSHAGLLVGINVALLVAIILDMVLKPF